jgi:hypothetical protein
VNIKKWNAGALMAAGFTSKEHRAPAVELSLR